MNIRIISLGTLLATVLLTGCLTSESGDIKSYATKAHEKNAAQKGAWDHQGITSYQYQLSTWEGLYPETHKGTCQVSHDTPQCDLKNFDDDHYHPTTTFNNLFKTVDSLVDWTAKLDSMPEADSSVFASDDTSFIYAVMAKATAHGSDSSFNVPLGVQVIYDKRYGYPKRINGLPFGPNSAAAAFVNLTGK